MNSGAWSLVCSGCAATASAEGLPTVCAACGQPWLVEYRHLPTPQAKRDLAGRGRSMWRYREWLPILPDETPVTLGEGCTPLLDLPTLAGEVGVRCLLLKDESLNPTGSFKARGLSAAVTRAQAGGVRAFAVPTAGNAGVALAAYGGRADVPVRVFAPNSTPRRILEQIEIFGATLELLDGHIGDCGKAARAYADREAAFDLSTLREPYRIEGKKTLGLEIAEQLGWKLPDVVVYPTGGGTGLIGMWKAFDELRQAGWIHGSSPMMVSVQSTGCAPVVKAFDAGAEHTEPWERPATVASGLRVPNPFGGQLILRVLRETGGMAVAVDDAALIAAQGRLAAIGIDAGPEGGATLAALDRLAAEGRLPNDATVVLFNTGAGWLYRGE